MASRDDWTFNVGVPASTEAGILFTVYPDNSHNSWARTYDNPDLWEWLFAQHR